MKRGMQILCVVFLLTIFLAYGRNFQSSSGDEGSNGDDSGSQYAMVITHVANLNQV